MSRIPQPPSVYYRMFNENGELKKKVHSSVLDFQYKGNSKDLNHLVRGRLGPTPHLSQV